MFTPTLRCECAQPGLIDTMRKWSIRLGLLHVTRISLAVQYETIQFILLIPRMDGSTKSCTV